VSRDEVQRVIQHIDIIRHRANIHTFVQVVTKNSFPKGTGVASSASGFAALTVAGCAAAALSLTEKELTILARLGSGSACRSVPDGFVEWTDGKTSETSYAHSLYPNNYWDVRDILCIVETEKKKTSSSRGMEFASTSPQWETRQKEVPERIIRIKQALRDKNFRLFGEIIEKDCLSMHAVMNTQIPPLHYWNNTTEKCIQEVKDLRASGVLVYFTIDAGPNIHVICEAKDENTVFNGMKNIIGVQSILVNAPTVGAHIVETHLF
jgi:diphosphomevalonate decarboxylase